MDEFGKLIMEKLRDVSIELCEGLAESRYDSPSHKEIQKEIESFTTEQKEILIKCVTYCVDGGINDFLFNLDKLSRKSGDIALMVKGENAINKTEGLSRELYGENGWQHRYSAYGKPNT